MLAQRPVQLAFSFHARHELPVVRVDTPVVSSRRADGLSIHDIIVIARSRVRAVALSDSSGTQR